MWVNEIVGKLAWVDLKCDTCVDKYAYRCLSGRKFDFGAWDMEIPTRVGRGSCCDSDRAILRPYVKFKSRMA